MKQATRALFAITAVALIFYPRHSIADTHHHSDDAFQSIISSSASLGKDILASENGESLENSYCLQQLYSIARENLDETGNIQTQILISSKMENANDEGLVNYLLRRELPVLIKSNENHNTELLAVVGQCPNSDIIQNYSLKIQQLIEKTSAAFTSTNNKLR